MVDFVQVHPHPDERLLIRSSLKYSGTMILFGLVLFAVLSARALANSYEVEVVVFERPDSPDLALETWDFSEEHLEARHSMIEQMGELRAEIDLEKEIVKLAEFEEKLESGNLPVLKSARWIQPAALYEDAPVVSLGIEGTRLPFAYVRVYRTSLLFADLALQLSPENPVILPMEDLFEPIPEEPDTPLLLPTVPIEISDEDISDEIDPEILPEEIPDVPHYFLFEKRWIKFNEVHYFDHPAFGVILGIWPHEPEQ
ncbi:MAG: hypothetical protein F4244_11770 [Gammaproteobacteria bacterium]|nr:hypothetical protein [Gammaproteobacteria bacterium]